MKFYQITDLHYYPAKLLNAQGKAWINRAMYDQKCIAESEAILDATIQMLLDDKEIDIVLITGDNVCDGERVGHISLAEKLHKLTEAGKKVYIITGTHDLHPEPKGYSNEKGEYVVEGCTREELEEIPGFEEDLCGAIISEKYVVSDGNFITARGAGVAVDFGLEIVKALGGSELSNKIRETIQCQ